VAQILVRATVTTDGYCAGWVGYVDDTDPVVQELIAGGYLTTNVTVLPPPTELCCLPPGGTTNQILAKVSDLDRDANWQNAPPSLPAGPASGVLSGTYPNPIFAEDMATQTELDAAVAGVPEQAQDAVAAMIAAGTQTGLTATYNDALGTFSFTVTGAPPSGTAGGVLTGTYPNPTFASDMATQVELNAKQPLNVMDYGAVGDGTADDTTAVQNWVNACQAAKGFGVSPGGKTFRITTTLAFPGSGYYNLDFGGSTIKKDAAFASLAYAINVTGNAQIKNLVVDGNRAAGALGFGFHFSNLNANDVHLTDVRVINNFNTAIVIDLATVKVTCRSVDCSNNSTAAAGSSDGFRVTAGLLIMDRECQANDNERAGIFIDAGAHTDTVINGSVRRNLQHGVQINGANTHGTSQYLYGDDNKNFGLVMINSAGTFLAAANWNFGHVEMCRTGAAIGGTYTANNAGTGVQGYGIRNNTFEKIIGRGNLGYDFIMVAGNSADSATNSKQNQIATILATNIGPTGVGAADNDPSTVLSAGSSYNHIGQITCYGKTIALDFGESSAIKTNNDNYVGQVYAYGSSYTAVLFGFGARNYVGEIIARENTMGHPGSGAAQFNSPVLFFNDASVTANLVDRLDHYTSGTAFSYLAEFGAAATNNQVTRARGAFATALKQDAGTGNTVTAG
jgi:hypothetical protein